MSIPSIRELADEVYEYGQYLKGYLPNELREPGSDFVGGEARLQIHEGTWAFHTGDPQFDQDHRGAWGAASVPRGCSRREAREIARDLIEQAEDDS